MGVQHPDEITIELYVLGSPLDEAETASLLKHLEGCRSCRELHETMTVFYRDLEAESDADRKGPADLPVPTRRRTPAGRPGARRNVDNRLPASWMVETALPIRMARWMVKHPVVSATSGLGVLGLFAMLLFPVRNLYTTADTNPVNFHVRGMMLTIVNQSDSVLLREGVSEAYAHELADQDDPTTSTNIRILFTDVDRDGTNEFLQVRNPGRPDNASISEVLLRSVTNDLVWWRYPAAKQFNFPHRTEGNTPDFGIRTIETGDFDSDGRTEVYVVTSHSHFPTWVSKLDAVTGEELALFLHIGHIVIIKFADLDGDGIQEMIIGGRNNAFRQAFVAVLDPRSIAGRGPAIEPYIPEGIPPAAVKSYILFPRSIVGDAIDDGGLMEMTAGINVNPGGGYLRVSVTETNGAHATSSFTVVFDESMNAINYQTGDNFDVLSDSLYRSGLIARPAGPEYMREYLEGLRYLRGDGWTSRPLSDHFGQFPGRTGTD